MINTNHMSVKMQYSSEINTNYIVINETQYNGILYCYRLHKNDNFLINTSPVSKVIKLRFTSLSDLICKHVVSFSVYITTN